MTKQLVIDVISKNRKRRLITKISLKKFNSEKVKLVAFQTQKYVY